MKVQEFTELYTQTNSSAPAYQRIKDVLLNAIVQGTCSPGDIVPSENELVEALELSRMTVNRAMRELTTDGVLTRTRGIGTFIAEPKALGVLMEVRNIADEIKMRGHTHTSRVLLLEETDRESAPSGLGERVFHSIMVHYENGRPFQLEDRYVSAQLVPQYLGQDFTRITPNEYLIQTAPLAQGKHVVEAVLPSSAEAELLDMETSSPCLLIRRRTYSVDGLVSVAKLLHPGNRIRLEGDF